MSTHMLRDRDYKRIGQINTLQDGKREIRDTVNHRLGYYDPDRDMTFDATGARVGEGDLLTTLLED
jgi:hypothetical protein